MRDTPTPDPSRTPADAAAGVRSSRSSRSPRTPLKPVLPAGAGAGSEATADPEQDIAPNLGGEQSMQDA